MQIAAVDLFFGLQTTASSAALLWGLDDGTRLFCQLLGPAFDWTTFLLYMTIANLAHYSLYRLHDRAVRKVDLLWRYVCTALVVSTFMALLVTFAVFSAKGGWEHGFQLQSGMCRVAGYEGTVAITVLERCCELYILIVFVRMAMKARKHHSPAVVLRQQKIVSGYIIVALFQGVIFWVPWLYALLRTQSAVSATVQNLQFSFGLSWPVWNYIVFSTVNSIVGWGDIEDIHTLTTAEAAAAASRRRGSRQHAPPGSPDDVSSEEAPSIKVVGFAHSDSGGTRLSAVDLRDGKGWRKEQDAVIADRRIRQGAQLARLIKTFEPVEAPDSFAYKASAAILAEHKTEELSLLLSKHEAGEVDDLRDMVALIYGFNGWTERTPRHGGGSLPPHASIEAMEESDSDLEEGEAMRCPIEASLLASPGGSPAGGEEP